MFDLVAKYRKWIMIGLFVLIIPPFALFGMDQYFRDGGSAQTVATVGDYQITEQEFSQALRERQEQLRAMSGGRIDPALLDSPEQRFATLEGLVRQRILVDHAVRSGLGVTAEQLRQFIAQAPIFQENGQFSMERYQQFLKERGTTAGMFENRLRQDIMLALLNQAYAGTSFVPRTVAERLLRLTQQQREVSRAQVSPDAFVAQVKLEDGAAKKYYDQQQDEFRIPEQVRIEYVTLSAETIASNVAVDPAEAKKYYEQNQRQFAVPETREASHILIAVDTSAGEAEKKKARALAEQISAELKKDPARFAELAKKHSQDPGSAAKGGELGSFSRGSMVKAFDDAVFTMKPGEISAPVETEYGFHIIKVTGVQPGQARSFADARADIEKELRKNVAGRTFAETAEKLNNIVFEQGDSLAGAAELLKQAPQKSGWITRTGAEDAKLNNPKLLQAIFSDEVLNNKRNTEAIEIAPGVIVAARIVEHKPAAMRPFDEVKAAIEKKLVETRASQLAAQEGRRQLEALRQGQDVKVSWSSPQLVSRTDTKGYPEPVLRQVFKADTAKLPAYTGVEAPGGGFTLLKVTRVIDPEKIDRAQQNSLSEGVAQLLGEEHFAAYVESLKKKSKVRINKEQFERKS
ncbi:MAG TPA: SurA N-terminal domain-containing protein [Burkholderiales bacterium]|nr:SurA N-terminal domain-containing protein [Burkholderiales bacterium]